MSTAVWRTEWIHEYESPWSIFEKFSFANVTDKTIILRNVLGTDKVRSIKSGVVGDIHRNYYSLEGFDLTRLSNELLFDLHESTQKTLTSLTNKLNINQSYFNPTTYFHEKLHWCEECMMTGYHSLLHQFKLIHNCPFHLISLMDKCPECKEDIPFLLQDTGSPFSCKCGYNLTNLSHKWSLWDKTNTTIKCSVTRRWLELGVEDLKEQNIIFDPEYAFRNKSALKLIVHAIDESLKIEAEGGRVTKISCPSTEEKKWSFKPLPVPHARTVNCGEYNFYFMHYGYKYSPVYESIYQHSVEIFKSVDHHIKKTTLRGHENCLKRFVNFLKVEKDKFPPICPHAYAYTYWKQSLLHLEDFDTKRMAPVKPATPMERINIIAGPFAEEIRYYLYKVLEQSYNINIERPWQLIWLLNKLVSQYYLTYFKVLQELAQLGSVLKIAPNRKAVFKTMYNFMPFFVVRHPVNFQNEKTIDIFIISNDQKNEAPEFNCPYHTRSMKTITPNERRSSPLAYAMSVYSTGTRDETEEKYIDEYFSRLKFRMY